MLPNFEAGGCGLVAGVLYTIGPCGQELNSAPNPNP